MQEKKLKILQTKQEDINIDLSLLNSKSKKELVSFYYFLLYKAKYNFLTEEKKEKKNAKFGSSKGKYILSQDFDEPLNDFNEYM